MYHNLKEENDEEDSRLGEEQDQKQDCWRRWSLWHCLIRFSGRNPNRPLPEPISKKSRLKSIEISKAELGNWHHTETTTSCIKDGRSFKMQREKVYSLDIFLKVFMGIRTSENCRGLNFLFSKFEDAFGRLI